MPAPAQQDFRKLFPATPTGSLSASGLEAALPAQAHGLPDTGANWWGPWLDANKRRSPDFNSYEPADEQLLPQTLRTPPQRRKHPSALCLVPPDDPAQPPWFPRGTAGPLGLQPTALQPLHRLGQAVSSAPHTSGTSHHATPLPFSCALCLGTGCSQDLEGPGAP